MHRHEGFWTIWTCSGLQMDPSGLLRSPSAPCAIQLATGNWVRNQELASLNWRLKNRSWVLGWDVMFLLICFAFLMVAT